MGAQDSYRGMDNISRGLGDLFGIPTGGGMEQNSPSGEFVEPSEQDRAFYDNMSGFEKYFFNKEKNKANMNYAGGGAITGKSGEKVSGMGADTQLIVAQPGEFVIKKDAVKAIGLPYLRQLNALKTNKGGEAEYGIPAGKNIFGQPTEAMTQQELMEMMLPVGGVMSGFGLLRLQSPHGKAIAKRVAEVLKKHYKKFPKDKPTGVDKITGKSGGKTGMQQGGTVGYQEGDEVKKDKRHPKAIPKLKRFWEGSRMGGGKGWLGYDEGQWAPGVNIGTKGREGILGRLSDDELEWLKSNRKEFTKDTYKYLKEGIESRPTNIRQVLEGAYEEAKETPFTSLGMLAGAGFGYKNPNRTLPRSTDRGSEYGEGNGLTKGQGAMTGFGLGAGAGAMIDMALKYILDKRRQRKEEDKLQQ